MVSVAPSPIAGTRARTKNASIACCSVTCSTGQRYQMRVGSVPATEISALTVVCPASVEISGGATVTWAPMDRNVTSPWLDVRHAVRPQLRGVRGRGHLQALAGQDRHRVRRPLVLP